MQYLLLLHGNKFARTRLNVTLYVHCLSCSNYYIDIWISTWDIVNARVVGPRLLV
jgi:hypothetical protein